MSIDDILITVEKHNEAKKERVENGNALIREFDNLRSEMNRLIDQVKQKHPEFHLVLGGEHRHWIVTNGPGRDLSIDYPEKTGTHVTVRQTGQDIAVFKYLPEEHEWYSDQIDGYPSSYKCKTNKLAELLVHVTAGESLPDLLLGGNK